MFPTKHSSENALFKILELEKCLVITVKNINLFNILNNI
jgi:hypothetical protein